MNSNIDKIIKRVGTDTGGRWISVDDMEKFTELVVQESINVMLTHDYHGEWLGNKIKEHFGVYYEK